MHEVVNAKCGVRFDKTAAAQWNIQLEEDPKPPSVASTPFVVRPSSKSRSPSEATLFEGSTSQQHVNSGEEHQPVSGKANSHVSHASPPQQSFNIDDALEDKGDRLNVSLTNLKGIVWWALELSPTFYEWQDEHGKWWKQLR